MHADAARVAWYRFRCTLRRRWPGYLALALLLGLVGGLAMGSVAAARRTQAAFPAYLASTNPSDLTVLTGLYGVAGRKVTTRRSSRGSPRCPASGTSPATSG